MKTSRLVVLLLALALCLGVGTSALAKTYTIGFALKTLSNPYFLMMAEGIDKAAKDFGCTVIKQAADQETSTEQLIAIVESMIAKKVDAICVTPNDSTAFIPVFLKAERAGIPIIDVDVQLDVAAAKSAGLTYYYCGADNLAGGYMAGKALAVGLKGKGKVAILEGIPGVDNAEKRKAGAIKAFNEYPGIKLVASQTAHWATEEALNVMTNILRANPDLNGVFCANDNMAFGAITAIEAVGKAGKILVTSYDALDQAKVLIKKGSMLSSVDQNPAGQGYQAVKFALDRIKGIDPPLVWMVPLVNVTKDSLK